MNALWHSPGVKKGAEKGSSNKQNPLVATWVIIVNFVITYTLSIGAVRKP